MQEEENTMKQEVSASSKNRSFVGPSYNVDKGCVLKLKYFKYDNKKIKKVGHMRGPLLLDFTRLCFLLSPQNL